ncbi:MAG: hypothetical protein O3A00_14305 [Planctomycetota bacterium]|nr:hypothetical protein [Planctomycetota bacterium]
MIRGTVRGKAIELENETGLPEGQEVGVTVQPIAHRNVLHAPCDGLKRAFGEWGDEGEELDEFLEWNRQQRKTSRLDRQS